ncbi:Leucine rich repeat protein, partial [Spraguea lophii 42_110]
MNSLEILNIGGCYNLTSISSNLFKLENLKELDLSRNSLLFEKDDFISYSVYSDNHSSTEDKSGDLTSFVSYKSLKKLIIRGNVLSVFPRFFCNFINLEEIDISINLFEEIPYAIYSFTNLEVLNISYNRIKKITIENGMFNNLLRLYLQRNRITELSTSANALRNLETLDLSNNNFSKLDKNIFQLKPLNNVLVFGNIFTEIEKFPCERGDLMSLVLTLKDISVLPNIFCYNGIHE